MRLPTLKNSRQAVKFQLVSYTAIALLLSGLAQSAAGATLVWDDVPGTDGAQDGSGTWQNNAGNWFNETSNLQDQVWSAGNTAVFGAGGTAGPIGVTGTVNVGDMIFRPVAITNSTGAAYTFTGTTSTIAMADNSSIIIGDSTTNSANANGRLIFNTRLSGNNITIEKAVGSTQTAFVTLGNSSNTLTGTLSLVSADSGGLFVQAGSTGSLPSSTGRVDVGTNATLALTGTGITWTVPLTLNGSGAGNRGALRIDGNNTIFSGAITLAGNTLIARNNGALVSTINSDIGESTPNSRLTLGNAAGIANTGLIILGGNNTFTGGLVIAVSEVRLANAGALNSAAPNVVTFNSPTAPDTARSLTLNGHSVAVGGLVSTSTATTVKNGSGTPTTLTIATSTADASFAGVLADGDGASALSVVKTGSFAQTLSGANTFTGGMTLSEGTLNVNHASALGTGTFTIHGGTLGNTSGGAIVNANNNAMVWNGDFAFTAAAANTLNLGTGAVSLGSAAGASRTITVTNINSILTVGGVISDGTTANGLTKAGNGVLILGGNNTYTGDTIVSDGYLRITHGGALGSTTGATRVATTTANDVRLQLDNNIVVTGEALFTGYLESVGGSNTWDGTVQGVSGSALTISSTAAGGNLLITGSVNAEDTTGTDHSFTLTGAGNGEISGVISNALSFTKNGSGTWILSGANTYTTATTVNAGGLQVGKSGVGQTGTGAVTIKNTAKLFGTGVVRGSAFTLESGASLYGGDGIGNSNHGTLTFTPTAGGNYTLAAGSNVTLSLGGATVTDASFGGNTIGSAGYNAWVDSVSGAGNHDRLVFDGTSGTLTISSNILVVSDGFTPFVGQAFNLIDWAAALNEDFNGFLVGTNLRTGADDNGLQFDLPDISAYGYYWDVSRFTTSGVIVVVPEPGRMMLLAVGLGMLVMRRRRKARDA